MGLFISAAHAATAASDHGGDHGGGGLPQLDFASFPSQIFWLVVTLVALYLIFVNVALPKIGGVIEERHDAIEDDLDRAAELRRMAGEAEAAYEKALADARAEAGKIADAARAEIQKDVDAAVAKADAEIAARTSESEQRLAEIRADAQSAVAQVAQDAAAALVEAVAPGAADDAAVAAAVQRRMEG
ncbi:MAG: F0F1 ATP synthase subunit B' [Pseudomonadota bacterium]